MKYLEYEVKNMSITKKTGDKTALISGAVNYFGMHFDFDEEFSGIPGAKSVEFYKNRNKIRVDLLDNSCAIPNELLTDKNNFEIRVVSGNTIATPWVSIGITESGVILPESPDEEPPETMEYVKTYTGDHAAPLLRATTNGLEYSTDGENWNSGVSGVPEVPSKPKDAIFGRTNGDWVRIDKILDELQEAVSLMAGTNAIVEVKVNGVALAHTDGAVDIDLSAYAEKSTVEALQTLQGTAEEVSDIDYGTADISDVISAYNTLLSALRDRGVIL